MDYNRISPLLGSWGPHLKPFIESEKCDAIYKKLREETDRGIKVGPSPGHTYRVFEETPMKATKVVFLLQDPYPWEKDGIFTADGIAMSSATTGKIQPSLEKFYRGMENDLYDGLNLRGNRVADLSYLSHQGIMLLNCALTVEVNKASSHYELWMPFTTFLFEEVFSTMGNNLIFVLCGDKSHYYEKFINPLQHRYFKIEHPAAASHMMRDWKHEKIFSKLNKLLLEDNIVIDWIQQNAF